MGCIEASAYTTGTILGTHSSLEDCEQQCGVCCIPQCDGTCEYCVGNANKLHAFGTYVVTGGLTVTYVDPMNPCDPWHQGQDPIINYSHTFTIDGTYEYDGWRFWVNTSDPRVYIDGSVSWDTLEIWIDQPGSYNYFLTGRIGTPNGEWLSWYPCVTTDYGTVGPDTSYNYYSLPTNTDPENCLYDEPGPGLPAGLTIGGGTINITFIPSNTNRSSCEGAGGLFVGLDFSYSMIFDPDSSPYDSCLFQSYNNPELYPECNPWDPDYYACRCPAIPIPTPGNTDFSVDWVDMGGAMLPGGGGGGGIYPGACCEGMCSVPFVKTTGAGAFECFSYNNCLDFSAVPNTSGCNDTITQSGCVQGGVYSPTGIAIGVWHSGQNCTTFDCNA